VTALIATAVTFPRDRRLPQYSQAGRSSRSLQHGEKFTVYAVERIDLATGLEILMSERRQSLRPRRSLEGLIGYDGRYRLRCLILDVSPSGAKLSLKAPLPVPAEFFLRIFGTNIKSVYWACTKWRRGNVLGVAFGEAPAPVEPLLGVRPGHGSYRA
jgi:hypothetical protein